MLACSEDTTGARIKAVGRNTRKVTGDRPDDTGNTWDLEITLEGFEKHL